MEKELKGTVVLVTGASSGIGEATALMLAHHGASVAIVDAIAYIVTRPRHIAINEILIRPTEQEG